MMRDDRLISLNAAIDALWHSVEDERGELQSYAEAVISDAEDAIKALPPAQPGWIPWDSRKLPKESRYYTVTAYDGATKRVTYAKYQKRLKRWELTGARAYWRVLAWLPPIEPWEGERDG